MRKGSRNPATILGAVVFPLLFLALFNIVMRRVMGAQGFDYVQLLPPAIVVQAMLFAGMSSAYYIAEDRLTGFTARLRSLPIHRAAPVVARSVGDLVRAALSLAVVTGVGVAAGMRFDGAGGAAGFAALALGTALVCSLGMGLLGYVASSPEAAISLASLPYLPLLMLSSAFVPVENFPGWLQPAVEWQPVTCAIDSLRALAGGGDVDAKLPAALAWIGGLGVAFAALGARAFRRAS